MPDGVMDEDDFVDFHINSLQQTVVCELCGHEISFENGADFFYVVAEVASHRAQCS